MHIIASFYYSLVPYNVLCSCHKLR